MKAKASNLFNWFSKSVEDINIVKSRSNFNPSIELERQIGEQIYNALQGTVVEEVLKKLKEFAEFEGYMENAKEEFAALENKLQHNLDLELDRFAKDIKPLIVKRYYFEKGAVQEGLKDDPDLKKALEVLQQPEEYKKVLTVAAK